MILLQTTHGDIKLELDYDKAPKPRRTLNSTFVTASMTGLFFTV